MSSWKGLFTDFEAKTLVNCIESHSIKNSSHSNRDNLKIAVNDLLGSQPLRDSIINKIEGLTQEQVNEIINASEGISRETSFTSSTENLKYKDEVEQRRGNLINSIFQPQEK